MTQAHCDSAPASSSHPLSPGQLRDASETDGRLPGEGTNNAGALQNLLGGAANLEGTGRVGIDDMRPDAVLRSVTATAFAGGNGVLGTWRVDAFAICANT